MPEGRHAILVDSLGDDFPTFPQFQRMLRDYECDLAAAEMRAACETAARLAQKNADDAFNAGTAHGWCRRQEDLQAVMIYRRHEDK